MARSALHVERPHRIIGVILFIGLALAGALFLGPRFLEAAVNSKASAALSHVAQASYATNLYELHSGSKLPIGNVDASSPIVPTFLKSVPTNSAGGVPSVREISGRRLMVQGGTERNVCLAIQKQANRSDAIPLYTDQPAIETGCMEWLGGNLIVYSRI